MEYVQAHLTEGNRTQVSWIEKKKGVKVGSRVQFEDTKEWRTITAINSTN